MNRLISISGIVLIAIPVMAFYAILFRNVLNVPFLDDYQAILGLANHAAGLSPWNQLSYLLTAQHNEYKLVFEHGIVWTEFLILKRIDFRILCVIGDLSVVLIGIALWRMFLPSRDFAARAMLFVPVAWLLFQLQYVETLNWAMTSLQNLPVVAFSLLVILFPRSRLTGTRHFLSGGCCSLFRKRPVRNSCWRVDAAPPSRLACLLACRLRCLHGDLLLPLQRGVFPESDSSIDSRYGDPPQPHLATLFHRQCGGIPPIWKRFGTLASSLSFSRVVSLCLLRLQPQQQPGTSLLHSVSIAHSYCCRMHAV